jgi:predicted nucleotidyltransferase
VAYTEDPDRRRKDLDDLKSLLLPYEAKSDRIFGDGVFAAELDDIEYANAFLLGSDIGAIATDEDTEILNEFLSKHRMPAEELAEWDQDDLRQSDSVRFHKQLRAFEAGFHVGHKKSTGRAGAAIIDAPSERGQSKDEQANSCRRGNFPVA